MLNNLIQTLQMLRNSNPRQMAMQMLGNIAPQNETAKNLLNAINNNDMQAAQTILQATANQKGMDIQTIQGLLKK